MKIFQLLSLLSEPELKYFKKKNAFNSELFNAIFNNLISIDEENFKKNKAKIYRKINGKSFQPSNESYFRNQLSDFYEYFREELMSLWMNESTSIDVKRVINYLNMIRKRMNDDFFEKEWNYYYKIFESKLDYSSCSEMNFLYFNMLIRNPKQYPEAVEFLQKSYQMKLLHAWNELEIIKYNALNVNYSKEIYDSNLHIHIDLFSELEEKTKKEYFNPLEPIIKLLEANNIDDKWIHYKQCCHLLETRADQINHPQHKIICQGIFNFSVLLMYKEDLQKSLIIHEYIHENNWTQYAVTNPIIFNFNYSTLLLKLGYYEKGMKIHRDIFSQEIHVHESILTIFTIRDILFRLLDQNMNNIFNDLNNIMPKLYKDDQILYVRTLYAIYFMMSEDDMSAIRECDNAKKSNSFKSDLAKDEIKIIHLISKLIGCNQTYRLNSNPTSFQPIQKLIDTDPFYSQSTHLILYWVKNYLSQSIVKLNSKQPK